MARSEPHILGQRCEPGDLGRALGYRADGQMAAPSSCTLDGAGRCHLAPARRDAVYALNRIIAWAAAGTLLPPVLAQDGEEEVVLPFAVDQEVAAGVALLLEAGALERGAARDVGRQARRFDAVQAQPVEGEI